MKVSMTEWLADFTEDCHKKEEEGNGLYAEDILYEVARWMKEANMDLETIMGPKFEE